MSDTNQRIRRGNRRAKTETVAARRFARVLDSLFFFGTRTREEARAGVTFGMGHYRKYNGNCTCRVCSRSKPRYDRSREKRKEGIEELST